MHSESRPSTPLSPEAIAQLVEGHREFLAFLERRVESRAIAEDILQTAFARGLERGSHVQEEKVVAWFYRVLRNSVIDHYRRRSTSARALEAWGREFTETEEPEAALRQEICQCVSGLLSTLKPEYRQALQVVDLEDGKLSDLAEQSGISAENAAVRVHRARKHCAVKWNGRAGLVPSTAASTAIVMRRSTRRVENPTGSTQTPVLGEGWRAGASWTS